jgi:hypothetical protein
MNRSPSRRADGSPGPGILVLAFGIALSLQNLGVVRFSDVVRAVALSVGDLWPLLFVAGGIGLILDAGKGRRGRGLAGTRPAAETWS